MPSDKPKTTGNKQIYISCLELAKSCHSLSEFGSDLLHLTVPATEAILPAPFHVKCDSLF